MAKRAPAKRKAPAKKPGRPKGPTKLTKAVTERVVVAIRAGNYAETAARSAGISRTTFFRWMQEGEQPDASKKLRDFAEAVRKAEADAEVKAVAIVGQAISFGD